MVNRNSASSMRTQGPASRIRRVIRRDQKSLADHILVQSITLFSVLLMRSPDR